MSNRLIIVDRSRHPWLWMDLAWSGRWVNIHNGVVITNLNLLFFRCFNLDCLNGIPYLSLWRLLRLLPYLLFNPCLLPGWRRMDYIFCIVVGHFAFRFLCLEDTA